LKNLYNKTILLVLFFYLISFCNAEATSFHVDGGISKVLGEASDSYNMGFSVGLNMFHPVSNNISLGGRFAYNRWTPDVSDLEGVTDVSGSESITEIVPTIRFTNAKPLFFQLGFGYFLWDMDVTIKQKYTRGITTYIITNNWEGSNEEFGLSLGPGLTLGEEESSHFDIFPLYHIIFTEDEATKYFSLNLGVVLYFKNR